MGAADVKVKLRSGTWGLLQAEIDAAVRYCSWWQRLEGLNFILRRQTMRGRVPVATLRGGCDPEGWKRTALGQEQQYR